MDLITTPVVFGQSPPENSIVHSTSVSLTSRSPSDPVHLVQYDDTLPMVAVALTSNGQLYTVPSGAAVNVRLAKPDGHYVYDPAYGVSSDGQTVYIAVTVQMTAVSGKVSPIIEVVVNGTVAGTGFFVLDIDPNPIPEDAIESTDEFKTVQQLAAEVTQAAKAVTDNLPAINAIGENIDSINAVAQNSANISAVGGSIANVNSVAENLTPIQTAATNISAIQQAPQQAANAAASASAASQSAANAEDAAQRAEAAAGIDPSDYYTKGQIDSTLSNYPTTSEVQSMIDSAAPQVMTKEFVIKNTVTNTYYAEYNQAISVSGYTPVSVGYRCGNAELNVYSCCLRKGMAFVGFTNLNLTNLSSTIIVTLVVTYIKT